MAEIGYALSSEEHQPNDLVRHAQRAEEVGFTFALISDHYHPWVDAQGQSPFVWSVIGGIAVTTKTLRLGTGVTCPIMRIHPAILAQAAATAAAMMDGRFFFGIGTGERLNEHIVGQHWPEPDVRLQRLQEAVEIFRRLWQGGYQSFHGQYFTVENARIYTLPAESPPIMIAASGPKSAEVAGEMGNGLIATSPDKQVIQTFDRSGGTGKPRYGQVTVCWAPSEEEAKQTAHKIWPNGGLKGPLSQELALPQHFQQAAQMVTPDDVAKEIVCGPDPQRHLEKIQKFVDAGFDHVYIHQVGPDQEGFFRFYQREILPQLR